MDDSTVPKVYFLNKAETSPIFGKWGFFEVIITPVFFAFFYLSTTSDKAAILSRKLGSIIST